MRRLELAMDTFSACMARVKRLGGMVIHAHDITVELANGAVLEIEMPLEEMGPNKPRLVVHDSEFLVQGGVLRRDGKGCLSGWVGKGAMEYVPDPGSVMCTQEVEEDGTAVAKLEFVWEAWDDLYDAIALVHGHALCDGVTV